MKILKDNFAAYQAEIAAASAKEFTRKHTCHYCLSELEYTEKDIAEIPVKLIDKDETIPGKGFYCPLCGGANILG